MSLNFFVFIIGVFCEADGESFNFINKSPEIIILHDNFSIGSVYVSNVFESASINVPEIITLHFSQKPLPPQGV
jgi:hypothetical protein